MNRRSLLTAAGVGMVAVSGCLGDTPSDSPNDEGSSDSVALTLSNIEPDEDPEPLAFEIELLDDQLSETEVPTFDIRVENIGDEMATWTQAQSEFAFPSRGTADGISIGLEDEITSALMDTDGCARTEFGIERDDIDVTTELEPAESIEQRYAMAGSDVNLSNKCPSPGTQRAEWEYDEIGTWGFEFQLSE